jgi:hypothetical protein
MLRERGAEEAQELARWPAEPPKRDRFGGLKGGASFRATGFFRTEQRDGRWWLVTPEGNPQRGARAADAVGRAADQVSFAAAIGKFARFVIIWKRLPWRNQLKPDWDFP